MAVYHPQLHPSCSCHFLYRLRQPGFHNRLSGGVSVTSILEERKSSARERDGTRHDADPRTAGSDAVEPFRNPLHVDEEGNSNRSAAVTKPHPAARSLAEIFPPQHVQQWKPTLALYFPIGCLVAAFRMALWAALILVDREWLTDDDVTINVLLFLLGIDVRWHNEELIPAERHVLVSNHVTTGDLMMLYKRPQRYVHLVAPGLPQRVTEVHSHRIRMQVACKETFMQLAGAGRTDSVHLFPEGGMTNGEGMMPFSRGFMLFAQRLPVVPVALRAGLPWGLHTHTLTSSFAANMFWFCFAPWVRLDAVVLQPMQFCEGTSKPKFVERVQRAIADELAIPISDITIQRKREVVKLARKLDKI